jgi:hypothetical protein
MTNSPCPECGKSIVDCHRYSYDAAKDYTGWSGREMRLRLSLSGGQWSGARCHGFTRRVADRIAAIVGEHPSAIWPEVVDHDIEDAQTCCVECGDHFMPPRLGTKYCSATCRNRRKARDYQRRRRAADADYRERNRQYQAAYRQQYGDYTRAYGRRWYHKQKEQAA